MSKKTFIGANPLHINTGEKFYMVQVKKPDFWGPYLIEIRGRTPKKGDVIKLTDKQTGEVTYTRLEIDLGIRNSKIEWDKLIGKIITVLNWLERILLFLKGMLPPKTPNQ